MTDVLVTGTFNILHAGHVDLMEYASTFGRVTVGVNGDQYQMRKYGKLMVPAEQRRRCIEACRYVEGGAVVFEEDDPSSLIRLLRPRVFVRGPDYSGVLLPEQPALNEVGCLLIVQPAVKIASSTAICGLVAQSRSI
jgi:D-beta-D-heptose 7-phosphate kinase/D-beta-D-heptose 1-phosphate adenosyltransferase